MIRRSLINPHTRPFLRNQGRWIAPICFIALGMPLIVASLVVLGLVPVDFPNRSEASADTDNSALTDMWLVTYDTDISMNDNQNLAPIDTKAFGESIDSVIAMNTGSTEVVTIDFAPNMNGTTNQRCPRCRRALINEIGAPLTFRVIASLRIRYPCRCGNRQRCKLLYRLVILTQFRVNRRTFTINLRLTNGLNIQANFRLLQLDEYAQTTLAKANSALINGQPNTTTQATFAAVDVRASMCSSTQAYIQGFCVGRGMLGVAVKWTRKNGKGNIIVRTPNNKIIYYGNPGPAIATDQGQHEQVGDGTEVDNIYWISNTVPPSGTYSACFSTGTLFTSGDTSPVTVTIELRRPGLPIITVTHTFTASTSSADAQCMDTSDIFVVSFDYPTESLSKNSTSFPTLSSHFQTTHAQSTVIAPITIPVANRETTNVLSTDAVPIAHPVFRRQKRDQDEVLLPTCTSSQACGTAVSAGSGTLSVDLRWSRVSDQASIIVQIAKNEITEHENPSVDVTTAQSQQEQVGNSTDINNTYWTSKTIPSSGDYSTCFKTGTMYISGYTSVLTVCWKKENAF